MAAATSIFKIAALGLVSALLCLLVKRYKPEMALPVTIAAGALILISVINQLSGVLASITDALNQYGLNTEYMKIVLKVIGVGYIIEFTAQICRDAGESALASKIEIAGRIAVLALVIPVLMNILKLIASMLPTG